jgi:hypothetical protein
LFENFSYHSSNNFFILQQFIFFHHLIGKHESQNLPKVQATVNIGGITHVSRIVFKSVSHDNLCQDEYNNSIRSQLFYGCISGTIAWLLLSHFWENLRYHAMCCITKGFRNPIKNKHWVGGIQKCHPVYH